MLPSLEKFCRIQERDKQRVHTLFELPAYCAGPARRRSAAQAVAMMRCKQGGNKLHMLHAHTEERADCEAMRYADALARIEATE